MKFILLLLTFLLLESCSIIDKRNIYMTDDDFVENGRKYSPDSTMMILKYSLDIGALGYSQSHYSIFKIADSVNNLEGYTLPENYMNLKWIDNKTVAGLIDIIPTIRAGENSSFKSYQFNDVYIKEIAYDFIESNYHMEIETQVVSPNGRYEFIAYRYLENRFNLNFIHLSIIPKGGSIPKYGNYFIADMQSDYILYGEWDDNNNLIFYTNKLYENYIQYFFVKNKVNIPYKIIVDEEKYSTQYRWVGNN